MTYFRDLSDYSLLKAGAVRPETARLLWLGHAAPDSAQLRHGGTKNVGWLDAKHNYDRQVPSEELLEVLWAYCKISVVQTRGIHRCELCVERESKRVRRGDEELVLGSAEIRVFSNSGVIYAAPNLIYHYVAAHDYCPPDEFLRALKDGAGPGNKEYFDRLAEIGLEWRDTLAR
jgi:hypothetical protein